MTWLVRSMPSDWRKLPSLGKRGEASEAHHWLSGCKMERSGIGTADAKHLTTAAPVA
jgi:hypothetical protein